jgi:hypothetical protein
MQIARESVGFKNKMDGQTGPLRTFCPDFPPGRNSRENDCPGGADHLAFCEDREAGQKYFI